MVNPECGGNPGYAVMRAVDGLARTRAERSRAPRGTHDFRPIPSRDAGTRCDPRAPDAEHAGVRQIRRSRLLRDAAGGAKTRLGERARERVERDDAAERGRG